MDLNSLATQRNSIE